MNPPRQSFLQGLAARLAAHEPVVVIGFAVFLFVLNFATFSLYPTSWVDEAMFSDPAINFVTGKGFVSTAWFQSKNLTWSGNVPLYTSVLVLWIKCFGAGLLKVRAFNYLVISLVIPVFWSGIRRLGCVASAPARIALIVTVFLSYSLCFPYRSARPDCLGMLICAGAMWAWSVKNSRAKCACLFLAGMLVPLSGLQLIGYFGLLCVLAWLWEGKRAVIPLAMVASGILCGGLALFLFYYCNHLDGIIETIKEARRLNGAPTLGAGAEPFWARLRLKGTRIVTHHLADYGITPTLAALLVLATARRAWADANIRRLALIAIGSSFVLVATLEMTLHYLAYYHWMNYIILAVTVFAIAARAWHLLGPARRGLAVFFICVSVLAGLPMRLIVGAALGQPGEFTEIGRLVEQNVQPADVVFTDFMGYFPAKTRAAEIYVPTYHSAMSEQERRSVNVLILDPINFDGYYGGFADTGKWTRVAGFSHQSGVAGKWVLRFLPNYMRQPTSCGYGITILRREPAASAANPP